MQSYEGYGSRIDVDEHSARIVRTGLGKALVWTPGASIGLNTVTGVTFKPASMLSNGLLQLNSWTQPRGKPSPSDPCTVAFTRKQQAQFQALAEWLIEVAKWNRQYAPAPTQAPVAATPHSGQRRAVGSIRRVQVTRRSTGYPATGATYTAIDLETTGLDPGRDKIVEVGLVKFTADGQVVDEFATLVNNPGSSREAREIHRIEDADLLGAPSTDQVLPEVFALIDGTVLVAHNLDFELPFLLAAAKRHRVALPDVPALCTLQTCRRQLEGNAFGLGAMYKTATGEWAANRHTALGDARATREVLLWLLRQAPQPLHLTEAPPVVVPVAAVEDSCPISCRPVPLVKASLAELLASFPQATTPRDGNPSAVTAYCELLDDCVEDGRLSFAEAQALTRQARLTRLTGSQLRELHWQAWQAAFPDEADADWSTIAPVRRREMFLLAEALGLTELASQLGHVIDSLAEPPPPPEARYLRGLRIAVYGEDPRLTALRTRAEDHGAKIAVNLTKTVAWLATTTPDSDDKRHSTATAMGIPIVSPDEGQARLDEAIQEAQFKAFERQRKLDEQQARTAHYAAEADAYWRPTWRPRELERDPDRDPDRSRS